MKFFTFVLLITISTRWINAGLLKDLEEYKEVEDFLNFKHQKDVLKHSKHADNLQKENDNFIEMFHTEKHREDAKKDEKKALSSELKEYAQFRDFLNFKHQKDEINHEKHIISVQKSDIAIERFNPEENNNLEDVDEDVGMTEDDVNMKAGFNEPEMVVSKGDQQDYVNTVSRFKRWPNGRIPYDLSSISSRKHSSIRSAIAQMNRHLSNCNLGNRDVWTPRKSSDRHYVVFKDSAGCSSHIGRTGGGQPLKLADGCLRQGIILHEMLHAMGFYHEHQRRDRDKYIKVQLNNVRSNQIQQFNKLGRSKVARNMYDYGSLMHYGAKTFSKNGKVTIVAPKPIGQRNGMSRHDVKKVRDFYGCR